MKKRFCGGFGRMGLWSSAQCPGASWNFGVPGVRVDELGETLLISLEMIFRCDWQYDGDMMAFGWEIAKSFT